MLRSATRRSLLFATGRRYHLYPTAATPSSTTPAHPSSTRRLMFIEAPQFSPVTASVLPATPAGARDCIELRPRQERRRPLRGRAGLAAAAAPRYPPRRC